MKEGMKYPHNVLEGFGNGAILDLRVRMAQRFIETSPVFHGLAAASETGDAMIALPSMVAGLALDIADELLKQASELGWIQPLPDDGELDEQLRLQAKRTAAFQALQQIEGNRAMQNEQSGITTVSPILGKGH